MDEFFKDIEVRVGSDGWKIVKSDRATVCVVNMLIPAEDFEEYNYTEPEIDEEEIAKELEEEEDVEEQVEKEIKEQEKTFGVNVEQFKNFVKTFSTKIKIEVNDKVKIEGDERKFTLPILEASETPPDTKQLDFKSEFEVDLSDLKEVVKEADMVSDSIVFIVDDKFKVKTDSDSSSYERSLDVEAEGGAQSRYPLDYLKQFNKGMKDIDEVKLHLGNNYPLKITTENMRFTLAPRVEE